VKTRDARLAENQELFRHANAGLERAAGHNDLKVDALPFLCECADEACMDTVALSPMTYEEVRSYPNRFFIVTGHQTIEGEDVVHRREGRRWIGKTGSLATRRCFAR
jgi:hypothetical protein